ncbi:response regulator [Brucepastera parasyntrophica]|uniref:response regulator n=1 Tax=Brucepastera parasyntrophica TaxID=2880008 RepID=UPI0021086261|nr:response regulator [Brucepastera parasyntrophica]ULQ58733.1 response regulator [Brucepastera parasyntrophica]
MAGAFSKKQKAQEVFHFFENMESLYIVDIRTKKLLYYNNGMEKILARTCFATDDFDAYIHEVVTKHPVYENPDMLNDTDPLVWETKTTHNNYIFKNFSSILTGPDGEKYHLCQVSDVTQLAQTQTELEIQLKRRDIILQMTTIFASLISLDDMINTALQILGNFLKLDRTCLFKQENSNRDYFFRCDYEWTMPAVTARKDTLQHESFDPHSPEYLALLNNDYIIVEGSPSGGKSGEQAQYPNGLVRVPVYMLGKFWGFLGCDNNIPAREWNKNDLKLMRLAANIIATGIERKNAENSIILAKETLRKVVDNTGAIIFWKDMQLRYIGCNTSFLEYFGKTEFEMIGKTDETIYMPQAAEQLRAEEIALIESKNSLLAYEKNFIDLHGEERWFSISKTVVCDNLGEAVILVGIYVDITERKRIELERSKTESQLRLSFEEAQKANRAKSDFLSRMSHEIRTPMNAIIGMTHIAKNASDPDVIRDCLNKTETSSSHLLSIINDILDMSKIEADKFELYEEEFSLEKALIDLTNIMIVRSDEKNQELVIDIDPSMPTHFIGDSLRLSQVITNLFSNAIKFTPEYGTIKLKVIPVSLGDEYSVLKFEVSDNGIGMTSEQCENVFSPFEQADGGIARRFGGTGLGLSISKKIVQLMSGEIHTESRPGKGSTFTFTVKLKTSSSHKRITLSEKINRDNLRVLAVDDSPAILEYFAFIFSMLNIPVTTAENGKTALELFKKAKDQGKPYTVIFVDWQMPGMNGIELAKALKQEPEEKAVIILISIAQLHVIEERAVEAGINKFLPKPLFPSAIVNVINEITGVPEIKTADIVKQVPDFSAYKVLLVEDIAINREIIVSFLKETGITIDCAENGAIAIEKISRGNTYDLILMDIHMPVMDGYTTTRNIRQLETNKNTRTPIVAMTANVFREDVEKCLAVGMDDHIAKPVEYNTIIAKLSHFLAGKNRTSADEDRPDTEADPKENIMDISDEEYLNLEEGLGRVMGNKALYTKLLSRFKAETNPDELFTEIEQKNFDKAQVLAHTIKGVAANLSLKKLFMLMQKLELELKNGVVEPGIQEEIKECIAQTYAVIDKVIKEYGANG